MVGTILKNTGHPLEIKGLSADSRQVRQGWLFAALPGTKADGRAFIADAVRHGAVAVLAPSGTALPDDCRHVRLIENENPRRAFSLLAAEFYQLQPEHIAAVTGTNGKTSCVHFARQLWLMQGIKAASLGTLGTMAQGVQSKGGMTTPDPASLHAELADLAAAGVTHLAVEASSHGFDQHRLDGVKAQVGAFTNLTRDHLDYHKTMESYKQAKMMLVSHLVETGGLAVLNADDDAFADFEEAAIKHGVRVLSYGYNGKDFKVVSIEPTPHGQTLTFMAAGKKQVVDLPLVGAFQSMNVLCALGMVAGEHIDQPEVFDAYIASLEHLKGVPGRVQAVTGHPKNAAIYIDYAHTPDALENVLKSLRPHTQGSLRVVFGCGGNRDRGKRAQMGQIAALLADVCIVTDDNPRHEDPTFIRSEILDSCPDAIEIGCRADAIRRAVADLRDGDVLIIAGKGHETGQIVGDTTHPFDDTEESQKAIAELK